MKFFLAIILIVGIASVTAGLLMMDHGGNCFMSSVIGGSCLDRLNIFEFFGVHLNFLKSFSDGLLASIIALLLLAVFIFSNRSYLFYNLAPKNSIKKTLPIIGAIILKIKFFNWLSFHINSPSFTLAAA